MAAPDVVKGFKVAFDDIGADGGQLGQLRVVAGIVKPTQAVAVPDHAASDVRADSPSGAGHQDSHARSTTSLGAPIRA